MLLALWDDDKQLEMHVLHGGIGTKNFRLAGTSQIQADQLRMLNSTFANHL